ncbi:MAG: phage portal protein [Thermoguttaceae bacterium]
MMMWSKTKEAFEKARKFIVNFGFYSQIKELSKEGGTTSSTRPTDKELEPWDRQFLVTLAREIQTLFPLAQFAVDKHVEYNGTYRMQCKTPYADFNAQFEMLFNDWKHRHNCDVAEKYCFDELLQIIERHRVVDGDVLIVKIKGGRLQIIEGDRVRNAMNEKDPADQWVHGVKCNRSGKVLQYHVAERMQYGGFRDERHIWAENAWLVAYRRNVDQVRGVTPMAPALHYLITFNRTINAASRRELFAQMLGILTKRKEPNNAKLFPTMEDVKKEMEKRADEVKLRIGDDMYNLIYHLNLGVDESAELIESNNPSTNTQNFWETLIRLILLSLHIPYTFYDGSKTTYFGAEGEYNQYFDACMSSRLPMIDWLNELTEWLLCEWVSDGLIQIPDGETIHSMSRCIRWQSGGMPFFLIFRIVQAALPAIQAGIISPQYLAAIFGGDYEENIVAISRAIEHAQNQTVPVPVSFGVSPQTSISA